MKPVTVNSFNFRNFVGKIAQRILPEEKSWHVEVIHSIAKNLEPENYLEVGIYKGETFRKVAKCAHYSVGIDIEKTALDYVKRVKSAESFHGTLQEFVSGEPSQKFDLVFIDADHMAEAVMEDFESATRIASRNAIIMLHDTWPKSEVFAGSGYCGTSYIAVNSLRSKYPDWSFVTIPVHPGLTIASRNVLPSWTEGIR